MTTTDQFILSPDATQITNRQTGEVTSTRDAMRILFGKQGGSTMPSQFFHSVTGLAQDGVGTVPKPAIGDRRRPAKDQSTTDPDLAPRGGFVPGTPGTPDAVGAVPVAPVAPVAPVGTHCTRHAELSPHCTGKDGPRRGWHVGRRLGKFVIRRGRPSHRSIPFQCNTYGPSYCSGYCSGDPGCANQIQRQLWCPQQEQKRSRSW